MFSEIAVLSILRVRCGNTLDENETHVSLLLRHLWCGEIFYYEGTFQISHIYHSQKAL